MLLDQPLPWHQDGAADGRGKQGIGRRALSARLPAHRLGPKGHRRAALDASRHRRNSSTPVSNEDNPLCNRKNEDNYISSFARPDPRTTPGNRRITGPWALDYGLTTLPPGLNSLVNESAWG